MIDYLSPLEAL